MGRPTSIASTIPQCVTILGVDPGTISMGFGVLEVCQQTFTPCVMDTITSPRHHTQTKRLVHLYENLGHIITEWSPDEIAVESPFMGNNVRSAFAIGEARAIVLLLAGQAEIPVWAYAPSKVKQLVAGNGSSNKDQVRQGLSLHLGLRHLDLPESRDASDALAVALCHALERRVETITQIQPNKPT